MSTSEKKIAIKISDILNDSKADTIQVEIAQTGRPAWIRRDLVEFYPGRIVVPLWLGLRILGIEKFKKGEIEK